MKKTTLFLILVIFTTLSYSQEQIGLLYDLDGLPLNGYFDPIAYAPKNKISKVHYGESYEVGYYYDSNGEKIDGFIKFENDKILFKKNEEEDRIKLLPNEISHFVIGIDSFLVIKNFLFKDKLREEPEFAQFIAAFNGYTFMKHYHFSSRMAQQFAMQRPITETILFKRDDASRWNNFPDDKYFKERALKYFGDIPHLSDKISSGDYEFKDLLSIIKMAAYYHKYKNSESILFDKYWQEIRDKDKAVYSAKIVNQTDSIWTFEYYKDAVKIYQANYSSFYPNKKNGDFISYYPNGSQRQIISYENNRPTEVKIYDDKGVFNTNYQLIENKVGNKTYIDVKYLLVNDASGNNIIKQNNKSTLKVFDGISKVSYTSKFRNDELYSYYRLKNSDTVFQITNPDYDFNIESLQTKFDSFMAEKKYDDALSENAQGIILVSLLIDDNGYAKEARILNSIHPDYDKLIDAFINTRLLVGAIKRYKFKPYKIDKEKRFYEVVVPFEFSINRLYRKPVNYNNSHFLDWRIQQEFFMQRQMLNNFTPNIPRGF